MRYILWVFLSAYSYAQIPAYYSNIDFTTGPELLANQLNYLITTTQSSLPYTSSIYVDTWDALEDCDLLGVNNENVLLIYGSNDMDNETSTDRTRNKNLSCHSSSCSGLWNREHIFAKSYADPAMDTDIPGVATDLHNIRACDSGKNSSRSNRKFIDGNGDDSFVGGNYGFYPGEEWKGDVARAIMYMHLRYLETVNANVATNGSSSYHPDMPDLFLLWNIEDPVSDFEVRRNSVIQNYQGNRNPFIDNPFLATLIWGGPDAPDSWNLSVDDIENSNNEFTIAPNPVQNILYLSSDILEVHIFNSNGQTITQTQTSEINVESLEKGIYFISIKDLEGKSHYSKFIKN